MNTYAFLVGIEKYTPRDWDIEGPCSNAIAIARWLLSITVPPSNIHVFLAAQDNANDEIATLVRHGISVYNGASHSQIGPSGGIRFLIYVPRIRVFWCIGVDTAVRAKMAIEYSSATTTT
jgi:hypothetical protein